MRDPTNFLKFIQASVKASSHKFEFLAALESLIVDEHALRRLLAPATAASTLAIDSSHLNSVMRMLLSVAELQVPLVEMLLGSMVAFAGDGDDCGGGGIVLDGGVTSLPRVLLSHLRWLDNVAVNGAAIAQLLVDNLEVAYGVSMQRFPHSRRSEIHWPNSCSNFDMMHRQCRPAFVST